MDTPNPSGYRKFLVVLLVLVLAAWLCRIDKLSGALFVDPVKYVTGFFLAANVLHVAASKLGITVATAAPDASAPKP